MSRVSKPAPGANTIFPPTTSIPTPLISFVGPKFETVLSRVLTRAMPYTNPWGPRAVRVPAGAVVVDEPGPTNIHNRVPPLSDTTVPIEVALKKLELGIVVPDIPAVYGRNSELLKTIPDLDTVYDIPGVLR